MVWDGKWVGVDDIYAWIWDLGRWLDILEDERFFGRWEDRNHEVSKEREINQLNSAVFCEISAFQIPRIPLLRGNSLLP